MLTIMEEDISGNFLTVSLDAYLLACARVFVCSYAYWGVQKLVFTTIIMFFQNKIYMVHVFMIYGF